MNLANALSMLLVFLIGFAAHRASLCIAVQWQARWFEELTGLQNTRSTAGGYINSNNRNSVYLGAQWLPMAHGPVKLGLQGVLITGYLEQSITPTLARQHF